MRESLGFVEVAGLLPALTVADTMVKTAYVSVLDIETAKGGGWMTVKVVGGVGAVTAAVTAGEATANQLGSFISKKVIPRPDEAVWKTFGSKDEVDEELLVVVDDTLVENLDVEAQEASCNLCFDSSCTRRKGNLKTDCIHYKK
jgi:microcompartment protein CcmL/EutN